MAMEQSIPLPPSAVDLPTWCLWGYIKTSGPNFLVNQSEV